MNIISETFHSLVFITQLIYSHANYDWLIFAAHFMPFVILIDLKA